MKKFVNCELEILVISSEVITVSNGFDGDIDWFGSSTPPANDNDVYA